jgi:hypothetical protein
MLALAGFAWMLWDRFHGKKGHERHSALWLVVMGWSLILTSGFHTLFFHYTGKMRSLVYLLMLIPLAAYLLVRLAEKIPKIRGWQKGAILVMLILFMHPPWGYSQVSFNTKVDAAIWDSLQWVERNSDANSTVYSLFGFYQHSHLLSNRPGNYAGESSKVLDYFYGKGGDFPLYCVTGYDQSSFPYIKTRPCPLHPSTLEEYDFLLADYLSAPNTPSVISIVEKELFLRGFERVYWKEEIAIYQNKRANI